MSVTLKRKKKSVMVFYGPRKKDSIFLYVSISFT